MNFKLFKTKTDKTKSKVKSKNKPELITLRKYRIYFTTVDGKEHVFTRLKYCAIPEYDFLYEYLHISGELVETLRDDNDVCYLMNNIISVKCEVIDTIENVIKKYHYDNCGYYKIPKIYYSIYNNEIDIYNSEEIEGSEE